jgi:hypothetical protein
LTTTSQLTVQQIFDHAPLGAKIRYSDGAAEPPKRFTRKHADWRRNNGCGVLFSKNPPRRMPSYELPGRITLHEGNFGGASGPVIIVHRTYLVSSTLRFEIESMPAPGSVQVLNRMGDEEELLYLAANTDAANAWLAVHRYADAYLQKIPEAA